MLRRTLTCASAILIAATVLSCGQAIAQPPGKKLIEYGWDVPAPGFVAKNIRAMEKRPFDGLIMRVPNIGSIFRQTKWNEEDVAGEFEALASIEWDKFTDNFIIMYAASTMDWFDDAHWEAVLHNTGLCAKAAKVGRCKGVCFDAEPYGRNPWHYATQIHADTKTFAEYEDIVRKRGAQWMDKVEEYVDPPVVHTFFVMSLFRGMDPSDRVGVKKGLENHHYGLMPAFFEGVLSAANQGAIITDGNEPSYYYQKTQQYDDIRDLIHDELYKLLAPEAHEAYKKHVQCAQALYVDHLFDMRTTKNVSAHMTPEERAAWFEHNVYSALRTSDRYVWLYSEKMNWWLDRDLPPGLEQAVVSARNKGALGRELGFDIDEIMAAATERQQAELRAQMIVRNSDILNIPVCDVPLIDGELSDDVWKKGTGQQAFVPYVSLKDATVEAPTYAWVAWDEVNLYVAVMCTEPDMDRIEVVGARRDQQVWLGDSVDLFVGPGPERTPYYHIIINPDNVRWDAVCTDTADLKWNPEYKSATSREESYWTVELEIPWLSLGMDSPAAGTKLFANIGRQRAPTRELTSWSQCIGGFVEPGSFGEWTLK